MQKNIIVKSILNIAKNTRGHNILLYIAEYNNDDKINCVIYLKK